MKYKNIFIFLNKFYNYCKNILIKEQYCIQFINTYINRRYVLFFTINDFKFHEKINVKLYKTNVNSNKKILQLIQNLLF